MDRDEVEFFSKKKKILNRGNISLNIDYFSPSIYHHHHNHNQGHHQYQQQLGVGLGGTQYNPGSPSGTCSSSSSLDTCLGEFPFRSSSRLGKIGMSSGGKDGNANSGPALFAALPSHPIHNFIQGSFESTSTSPLYSAMEASECSMPVTPSEEGQEEEDAVASSDDAMCSSPLMAEVKGRRFQSSNHPSRSFSTSTIDSKHMEAISQWQEGISPPVPAIPTRFQVVETSQSAGWTRSELNHQEREVESEVVRVEDSSSQIRLTTSKEIHRSSMNSSTRRAATTITTMDLSEQSLDTCINSIGTYASTLKSQGDSNQMNIIDENCHALDYGIAQVTNGLLLPAKNPARNSPFAYGAPISESNTSLSASRDSRPQTATRRIAFSPSVRIGKVDGATNDGVSTDEREAKLSNERSMQEARNDSTGPPPAASRTFRDIRVTEGRFGKKKVIRPLTAPDANGQTRPSFKSMLRPLSRQCRDGPPKNFFGRPMSRGKASEDASRSIQARANEDTIQSNAHLPQRDGRFRSEVEHLSYSHPGVVMNQVDVGDRPNKSERDLAPREVNTQRRSLLDGCPTYAETMAARYETSSTQGSYLAKEESLRSDGKNAGGGVIRRVVSKLTEAFSSNKATSTLEEEENGDPDDLMLRRTHSQNWQNHQQRRPPTREKYREFVKQSKNFLRPMTAPYADGNEARPMSRKGDGSEGKKPSKPFQMVSRDEPTSQPSILMGQSKQFRSCEQLRDRQMVRDHRLDTARPYDRALPAIPNSHFYHPSLSSEWEQQQRQAGMSSSSYQMPAEPPISTFSGRVALVPITRVSKDELKKMQPVRIVKCPEVDGRNQA